MEQRDKLRQKKEQEHASDCSNDSSLSFVRQRCGLKRFSIKSRSSEGISASESVSCAAASSSPSRSPRFFLFFSISGMNRSLNQRGGVNVCFEAVPLRGPREAADQARL